MKSMFPLPKSNRLVFILFLKLPIFLCWSLNAKKGAYTLAAEREEKGDSHRAFGMEARRETLREVLRGIGELAEVLCCIIFSIYLQNKKKLGGKLYYIK